MTINRFFHYSIWLLLIVALTACSGGGGGSGGGEGQSAINGRLSNNPALLEDSVVTLYSAGLGKNSGAVVLDSARTNADGSFHLSYVPPADPQAVLYLVVEGAVKNIQLASVLGLPPVQTEVVVNERTTVAAAYAMAQFTDGVDIKGTYPGMQNAAAILRNLVNIETGDVGSVLNTLPNGTATTTLYQFNSLANLLAACVEDSAVCDLLFAQATPPGGQAPENTFQAAVNIAHYPWRNVDELYNLSTAADLYQPALTAAPNAWALAIIYEGNGSEFDGPGNIAFDSEGNAWISNNYTYSSDPHDPDVCGDDHVLRLTPTGEDYPGAPYQGGGLYGAGFGITLDLDENVWVGNFGFQGSKCAEDQAFLWNTVSKFDPNGVPISPDRDGNTSAGGYLSDNDAQPQGMVTDTEGNIWVANCRANSITKFIKGDPDNKMVIDNIGLEAPFDITIDPDGNAWVTSNGNDSVFVIDPSGSAQMLPDSSLFRKPMGLAGDSRGNIWVSSSGVLPAPCGDHSIEDIIDFLIGISGDEPVSGASVTMLQSDGTPAPGSPFTGDNLYMPWGIAVDGKDNVFVANFHGRRLSYLCGANTDNCPPGFNIGDPISPAGGYIFEGLVRNTGVQIDPSGNVWLANNWEMVPYPTNPGGHQMVVFIGLAAPVKTPLIGPPRQP